MRWVVVIPVKVAEAGKTRLAAVLDPAARAALVRAMALDTLDQVRAVPAVERVVVVTADPVLTAELGTAHHVQVVPEPPPCGDPLAAAVRTGLAAAGTAADASPPWSAVPGGDASGPSVSGPSALGPSASGLSGAGPSISGPSISGLPTSPPTAPGAPRTGPTAADRGLAVLLGDLPRLRAAELAAALESAAGLPRAFVPDASGTGTTLLTAVGVAPRPRFGPGSAAAHATAGHVALGLPPDCGLRRDVDTPADLAALRAAEVGPRTAALLARV